MNLLGRQTDGEPSDAGETDITYDAAGNLLTKLTAELRKSISDKGYISYTYDFERLHEVLYPENLFNRVTYTYGKAGDKYNRAGRLALVEDASGGEAYYYGRQGEVTKTVVRSWRVWQISGLMSMVLRMIAGTVCRR